MSYKINEAELHYVWYHQKLSPQELVTRDKLSVEVIDKGRYNENSGPDFLHAIIKIGETIWVGHVEIHIKSSDWFKHKHQFDPNYKNVILHVVLEDDRPVKGIPVLLLNSDVRNNHEIPKKVDLRSLPCATFFHTLPASLENQWKKKGLEYKLSLQYNQLQNSSLSSVEQLFNKMARFFGLYLNQDLMENLMEHVDWKWILRNRNTLHRIEGVLMGLAGFLEDDCSSDYYSALKSEFEAYKVKFSAQKPFHSYHWNYAKVHPSSYPPIRISQLARVLSNYDWNNGVESFPDFNEWKTLLHQCSAHFYWETHSTFGKESRRKTIQPGKTFVLRSYLNMIPIITFYQVSTFSEFVTEIQKKWDDLPAENNNIVRTFKKDGVEINTAKDTQSVLACYKQLCREKGCKRCPVGNYIFNSQNDVQETRIPYNIVGDN